MSSLPPVFSFGSVKDIGIHNAGAIAVEDSGIPPDSNDAHEIFLLLPGMGDFRQSYRYLGPRLYSSGHRVLVADLRGHGESSAGFPSYTPLDVSNDIIAILQYFFVKKPIILVGNSLSGSAIIRVAATYPNMVKAVIGLAPVCRDLPQDFWFRPLSYVLFLWPWGCGAWATYFKSLFKKNIPDDLPAYEAAMRSSLKQNGRLWAVAELGRGSKDACFKTVKDVKCPVLLVFGEKDPDFVNPFEEAQEIAHSLTATKSVKYEVIAGVGHYPHVEEPVQVNAMIINFIKDLS